MQLIRDWFSLHRSFPGATLSIGIFDGVHIGHRKILGRAVEAARRAGTPAVVFTFEPHPDATLHPDRAPDRILDFRRKLDLLAALGVDAVICPDGPLPVLAMEAEEFVDRIIVAGIGASLVVEGLDFRFGRGQGGDVALLAQLGAAKGFRVETIEPVRLDGQVVSSTRIRHAVRQGRVAEARAMLGRPFEFLGCIVHGRQKGRELGFPTINLAGGDFLIPGDGVYAGWATLTPPGEPPDAGRRLMAAISVGREPTFGELAQPVVEAHLLDFHDEVYGQAARLEFVDRVRDQVAFPDLDSLVAQIGRDCRAIRELLKVDAAGSEGRG